MFREFFSSSRAKILTALELGETGMARGRQNIEQEGVTGKIFQNKELAADLVTESLGETWHIRQACAFWNSQ